MHTPYLGEPGRYARIYKGQKYRVRLIYSFYVTSCWGNHCKDLSLTGGETGGEGDTGHFRNLLFDGRENRDVNLFLSISLLGLLAIILITVEAFCIERKKSRCEFLFFSLV